MRDLQKRDLNKTLPLGYIKLRLVASSVVLVHRFFHRYKTVGSPTQNGGKICSVFISMVLSMAKINTMVSARCKHWYFNMRLHLKTMPWIRHKIINFNNVVRCHL